VLRSAHHHRLLSRLPSISMQCTLALGGLVLLLFNNGRAAMSFLLFPSCTALQPPTHPAHEFTSAATEDDRLGYDTVACPSSSRDELAAEPS
jgi:hypothetical protein